MKHLKEEECLERTKRAQALREMTKLSRREFAKKQALPMPLYNSRKIS